jgi:DNA-binding response OmpR family regulator
MAEKTKILMIDDEQDLCFIVKANLEDTGNFAVVTTSNPLEAEDLIKRERPDLIMLDVVMPKRKGSDIVLSLKKDPDLKKIPIILVSGKGEMIYNKKKDEFKWMPNNPMVKDRGALPEAKGAEALAQAYGVDDYIAKPFTTDLLVEIVNETLAKSKKTAPPAQEASS